MKLMLFHFFACNFLPLSSSVGYIFNCFDFRKNFSGEKSFQYFVMLFLLIINALHIEILTIEGETNGNECYCKN